MTLQESCPLLQWIQNSPLISMATGFYFEFWIKNVLVGEKEMYKLIKKDYSDTELSTCKHNRNISTVW